MTMQVVWIFFHSTLPCLFQWTGLVISVRQLRVCKDLENFRKHVISTVLISTILHCRYYLCRLSLLTHAHCWEGWYCDTATKIILLGPLNIKFTFTYRWYTFKNLLRLRRGYKWHLTWIQPKAASGWCQCVGVVVWWWKGCGWWRPDCCVTMDTAAARLLRAVNRKFHNFTVVKAHIQIFWCQKCFFKLI